MVTFIVEGDSDKDFFIDFLTELEITKDRYNIKIFNGKDNIFKLSCPLYDEIENELDIINKIFIVVDADDPKDKSPIRGYEETQKHLKSLIKDLEFDVFIDYFIFSDKDKNRGFLETFLLSVIEDEQQECIENFKECYEYDLSDKFVYNTFYKQKKYPFDFSHPNFDELKQKLINLFE